MCKMGDRFQGMGQRKTAKMRCFHVEGDSVPRRVNA